MPEEAPRAQDRTEPDHRDRSLAEF